MAMPAVALILAFAPYLMLSSGSIVGRLQKSCHDARRITIVLAILLVPYLLVTVPMAAEMPAHFALNLLKMIGYVSLPAAALLHRPSTRNTPGTTDILVILFLALPVEFRLLPPAPVVAANFSVDVALLTALDLALFLFLVIRPVQDIGYSFRLRAQDFAAAFLGAGAYTAAAVPLGLGIGFIALQPKPWDVSTIVLQWAAIYFMTALPEEFLFRGLIQNMLKQRTGSRRGALVIASLFFGLTHLNNVTPGHGVPNFPYALMASLAGLAYGWVWQKTSRISASAITHATVNCVWHSLLSG